MKNIIILDGPTGTELIARGFTPDPILWTAQAVVQAPKLLLQIHQDYLKAGAHVITAATSRTTSYTLAKRGLSAKVAKAWTLAAVQIAKKAIGLRSVGMYAAGVPSAGLPTVGFPQVAGSLFPLEDCYLPQNTPDKKILDRAHTQTASWLKEAGCNFILAETMGTAREALACVQAARNAGFDRVWVSFIPSFSGKYLLGGDSLMRTARLCIDSGASAILVNCAHATVIEKSLKLLKVFSKEGIAIGAYANASLLKQPTRLKRGAVPAWVVVESPARQVKSYARYAKRWIVKYGATIVGTCCGAGPEYIRAMKKALR